MDEERAWRRERVGGVLFDFLGTHPLLPSLLASSNAHSAVERRDNYKVWKYHDLQTRAVSDRLLREPVKFIDDIVNETATTGKICFKAGFIKNN